MTEKIRVAQTFVSDGQRSSVVRALAHDGRDVTVYVENAGDFVIPMSAVISVQSEKVTFDCKKLEPKLRAAIGHAHEREEF